MKENEKQKEKFGKNKLNKTTSKSRMVPEILTLPLQVSLPSGCLGDLSAHPTQALCCP